MLAIAKISAARNRQPEMIVSLSISLADGRVKDVEGMWRSLFGRDPRSVERHRAAVIGPTSSPLQQEPAAEVRLCIIFSAT